MLVINKKIENVFPLSPLQEGMLFHSMLDPSSSQYVIQNTYTLKMNINKEAVGKALNLLSQRYSVLRTAFVYENMKKPRQIVMHEKEIEVNFIDYSHLDSYSIEKKYNVLLADDIKRGYDFQKS